MNYRAWAFSVRAYTRKKEIPGAGHQQYADIPRRGKFLAKVTILVFVFFAILPLLIKLCCILLFFL